MQSFIFFRYPTWNTLTQPGIGCDILFRLSKGQNYVESTTTVSCKAFLQIPNLEYFD